MANFVYGETELDYLRSRDARLADAIARIGHVERAVDPDLFAAVVHHIIGQQISTKAQATIWTRLQERLGAITPATVRAAGRDGLQAVGTTFRKADYIMDFADRVATAELDLDAIRAVRLLTSKIADAVIEGKSEMEIVLEEAAVAATEAAAEEVESEVENAEAITKEVAQNFIEEKNDNDIPGGVWRAED